MDHNDELARIFDEARKLLPVRESLGKLRRKWIVYGKGKQGRKVAKELLAAGHEVACFMDRGSAPGEMVDRWPCLGLASAPDMDKSMPVALALHNPNFSSLAAKAELMALGFEKVHLLQDMVDAFPSLEQYWLAPSRRSLENSAKFAECLNRFSDEASRVSFCEMMAFRLLGEPAPAALPDQYFTSTLPAMDAPLKIVDCGAFIGDTLDCIAAKDIAVDWMMAFEPDPVNFERLSGKWRGRAMLIPCGVSNRMGMASFVQDGAAGRLGESAEAINIQMSTIDDAIGSMHVNFIKMDVEGAELLALEGAAAAVKRCQPRMAIASYHHPDHAWMILESCEELGFEGEFMLRAHCENTFDMVLYALPRSRGEQG